MVGTICLRWHQTDWQFASHHTSVSQSPSCVRAHKRSCKTRCVTLSQITERSVPSRSLLWSVYQVLDLTQSSGDSWKPRINEDCDILHWATPLGSRSATNTKCVFISVYLCQLAAHRQCALPCLSNTMVFDKQGRQGCSRRIRVPGKELLRWAVPRNGQILASLVAMP